MSDNMGSEKEQTFTDRIINKIGIVRNIVAELGSRTNSIDKAIFGDPIIPDCKEPLEKPLALNIEDKMLIDLNEIESIIHSAIKLLGKI